MLLNIFKKKPAGLIKYFELEEWWENSFSDAERKYIDETFQPLGGRLHELTQGDVLEYRCSATSFLGDLAGWFMQKEYRHLAYKILEKAEELSDGASIIELHYFYQVKIQTYYRFRELDSFALEKAKEACKQQIQIGPKAAPALKESFGDDILPLHVGYKQLAIIYEKEGLLDMAIALSEEALKAGWGADWDNRIEKLQKKKSKSLHS